MNELLVLRAESLEHPCCERREKGIIAWTVPSTGLAFPQDQGPPWKPAEELLHLVASTDLERRPDSGPLAEPLEYSDAGSQWP